MLDKKLMTKDEKQMFAIVLLWSMALFLGVLLGTKSASAQMNNEPWGFERQNRASIAALMRQVEDEDGRGNGAVAAPTGNTLVCGGDGESAATGNSTCIILNNSDGAIQLGQEAHGSQDAVANEETTVNETINSDLSETLEGMDG